MRLFHPVIILIALPVLLAGACSSLDDDFARQGAAEFAAQPLPGLLSPVGESDLVALPPQIQKYLRITGSVGAARLHNFRVDFQTEMFQKPGSPAIPAPTIQYSVFPKPTRLFFMQARMYGLPVRVFHSYLPDGSASMRVRIASMFNVVDLKGSELRAAETVTFMNDIALMAPAGLVDSRFSFRAIDGHSVAAVFTNGENRATAVLYFNDAGELVNFVSDDRLALQDDGSLRKFRWSTPVRDYKEFNGRRAASVGEAVWHYPEGDFTYGKFFIKDIHYNVDEFQSH